MCEHENFQALVKVNRLTDHDQFNAAVKIHCIDCGVPFHFLGLPKGLDLYGATMSVDGTEARLAITPDHLLIFYPKRQ